MMKQKIFAALVLSSLLLAGCASPAAVETTAPTTAEVTFPTQKPKIDPTPLADYALADGIYTIEVSLEGGTGRATVLAPAKLEIENGQGFASIVWSSSNYDYMLVGDEKYEPVNTEGNSTFLIPVTDFDCEIPVVADTIAMSVPHEISYTISIDSSSIQKTE